MKNVHKIFQNQKKFKSQYNKINKMNNKQKKYNNVKMIYKV